MVARNGRCLSEDRRHPDGATAPCCRASGPIRLPRATDDTDARAAGTAPFPERLAAYLDGRGLIRDLVATYLAEQHLGFTPTDNEVDAAFDFASVALRDRSILTPEFSMRMMFRSVTALAPRLACGPGPLEDRARRRVRRRAMADRAGRVRLGVLLEHGRPMARCRAHQLGVAPHRRVPLPRDRRLESEPRSSPCCC